MSDVVLTNEEDGFALAGEYVLGVIDAAERAAVERRLRTDNLFAGLVARWEYHFAGLNDGFAEARVPDLMPQIEARLFGKPETRAAQVRPVRNGWWGRFIFGGLLAGALAILALVVLPPPAPPVPGGPVLTATLQGDGQALVFAARYDAAARELVLTRTQGDAAATGQVHELWLIAGQAAPVPLGLVETTELRTLLPELPEGAVLAISLEPTGGSPTGAPTGPVLVTGVVTRL